ncbi:UDP-N-acetylmuramoyl-L-alanyl-D-glutamate--2,6-diaminopimelate ligase [Candidatus Saganbacteria bacterium]|nr:UDP-N-acetylmuramoyl-L-alanyl-D-glutamate--2,6-diaminopimelate ligase [Candidatus Saganbacteria bacterium]
MKFEEIKPAGLAYDSRIVKAGDVFVAIPGSKVDGASFIPQAIEKGAKTIVAEKQVAVPEGIGLVVVPSARQALAELSSRFFGSPAKKLKIIGITGTNGKTTIAYLLESILREAGHKVGMIGTVETRVNGRSIGSKLTTPESLDLQGLLAQMHKEGVTHVVMEVSSHSLAQYRVWGIKFDIAIFTNLTHDHLDFHHTMEEYLDTKKQLFRQLKENGIAIVNVDDPYSKQIAEEVAGEVLFYGVKEAKHEMRSTKQSEFDIKLKSYDIKLDSMQVVIDTTMLKTPLVGLYNVYNILAAFQAGLAMQIDRRIIKKAIEKTRVPGRFERVEAGQPFPVIVDFAHSPDSLQKLLETVRPFTKGKLILVFGCPGDRDREKRPIMGRISVELADWVFITTDDPHSEDPQKILDDITGRGEKIIDRKQAIEKALLSARKGDIVVIAGRGHEKYQDFNGKKVELDDREAAREILGSIK